MVPTSQPQPPMGDVTPAGSQPTQEFPGNPAQLSAQEQLMYEQSQEYQLQLQQQLQRQLQQLWAEQRSEIEQVTGMKNHPLPPTRIRKIMRADEDVRMISAEAPALFAKACEMFTLEMTTRSWMVTEEDKRRVLQRSDIAAAVARTDDYDFLLDLFTREETKHGVLLRRTGQQPMGTQAGAYPYYYAPQQQVAGASMAYGGPSTYVWQEPQVQEQGHAHASTYVWQEPQQQQEEP
ncbi:Nuclear transcription factor Y subunit C-2 [Triticum urartu]|uniref:Nuclear transcription factor Y subunit C-2 n=2 Tax=Triticum urartu TaxID=4572 RepID=M7YT20_TRIUA|nr:nuclear transcription factor Y subunit C-4-like [Triticum urartu]EMS50241.1 Nuclear transcription factor Y subunit C-2 [Triticum urartu]